MKKLFDNKLTRYKIIASIFLIIALYLYFIEGIENTAFFIPAIGTKLKYYYHLYLEKKSLKLKQ
jgi:hypothetical protein